MPLWQSQKGVRIRQGGPHEEAALVHHLTALAPSSAQCLETAQLAELLVILGHEADARKLQAALSALVSVQEVREREIASPCVLRCCEPPMKTCWYAASPPSPGCGRLHGFESGAASASRR